MEEKKAHKDLSPREKNNIWLNLKLQIFYINTYGAQGTNTALHFQGFMYKYRHKSLPVTKVLCRDSFN